MKSSADMQIILYDNKQQKETYVFQPSAAADELIC